jgi:hypothetical protein
MTDERTNGERNADRTARIRELNDRLRRSHTGGQVMITAGVEALGPEAVAQLLRAVAEFTAFCPDNDPYGEHDCAVMEHAGKSFIWKIDYYDRTLTYGSPDPADPSVTQRVLTVMLSSEY